MKQVFEMGWILIFASWITCTDIWSTQRTGYSPFYYYYLFLLKHNIFFVTVQNTVFLRWVYNTNLQKSTEQGACPCAFSLSSPLELLVKAEPPVQMEADDMQVPLTLMTLSVAGRSAWELIIPSFVSTQAYGLAACAPCIAAGSADPEPAGEP